MRALYRPDSFLSISSETWTIMSSNYKTVHYKKVYDIHYSTIETSTLFSNKIHYKLYLDQYVLRRQSGGITDKRDV